VHRIWVLFPGACLYAEAADTEVRAGGIALTLPAPSSDFRESGDKLRTTVFELIVPSVNRLVSAWAPPQELAKLREGKASGGLDAYAMVEVLRQLEYDDCTPEAFQQLLKSAGASTGELVGKAMEDMGKGATEEMNARLKSLGQRSIEMNHPENPGALFQRTDAYGFAALTTYKQGDRSVTMATVTAVIRVRQRVLFAYIFRKYESPDTVISIGKDLEVWADGILMRKK